MLEFLLTIEKITGEPTDPKLMDYALRKAAERIKRSVGALLDKTPINVGKVRWRRWGRME